MQLIRGTLIFGIVTFMKSIQMFKRDLRNRIHRDMARELDGISKDHSFVCRAAQSVQTHKDLEANIFPVTTLAHVQPYLYEKIKKERT
jgi:hypothetical protein